MLDCLLGCLFVCWGLLGGLRQCLHSLIGTTLSPAPPHLAALAQCPSTRLHTRARPPTMGRLHASRIHGAVSDMSSQKRSLR